MTALQYLLYKIIALQYSLRLEKLKEILTLPTLLYLHTHFYRDRQIKDRSRKLSFKLKLCNNMHVLKVYIHKLDVYIYDVYLPDVMKHASNYPIFELIK